MNNLLSENDIQKGDRFWFKNGRGDRIFATATNTDETYIYYKNGSIENKVRRIHSFKTKNKVTKMKLKEEFDKVMQEGVTVSTSQYVDAHSKQPRGIGTWIFGRNRNTRMDGEKGKDWFQYVGNYTFAKMEAIKWAKKMGYSTIYTLS